MQKVLCCAIYTRVSTDNQAEKEFNSCEAQRDRIEHFIKSQDGFSVYEHFNDEGFSGKDLERPAMQRMLQAVVAGKIDCIITYKIDRLTRSPKNFYQLIEVFEDYKVDFISVTERFDTSTPSGRLLRNIMLTFAQFERELSSERTRDKMYQRAEKGMWNGGFVPFGYLNEKKKLIIHEKEAPVVRKMFKIYIETGSVSSIYEYLKKNNHRDRKGKPFTKSFIYYVLRNAVYTGKIKYGKKLYPGNHEAIVSDETFQTAQTVHREPYCKMRKYRENLFTGLVHCDECGSVMTPYYTTKKTRGRKKRYYYYRCSKTFKLDWHACGTKEVSANRLEQFVLDELGKVCLDEYYLKSLVAKANDFHQKSSFAEHEKLDMGDRVMFEKDVFCSEMQPNIFRRSLLSLLKAAENSTQSDRAELMRRSLKSIRYSREVIRICMYYNEWSGDEGGEGGQGRDESGMLPDFNRECMADVPERRAEGDSAGGHPGRQGSSGAPDDFIGVRVGGVTQHLDRKKELDHSLNDPVRNFKWLKSGLFHQCLRSHFTMT